MITSHVTCIVSVHAVCNVRDRRRCVSVVGRVTRRCRSHAADSMTDVNLIPSRLLSVP